MRNENKIIGKRGEKIAREYLEKMGYVIVETNFYCRFGEIDIIAKYNDQISFIEVKTRCQEVFGKPAESIDYLKRNRIYKVAEFYTYINELYDVPMSLDVIEVYILEPHKSRVAHIKNAIIENPYATFFKRG
ncbi:MAG: YraN family protein [Clostridia bacterium]|nr:YraN family protein [Clostridia bacterium]